MQPTLLTILLLLSPVGFLASQEDSDPVKEKSIAALVSELSRLSQARPAGETDAIVKQLKKQIEIADQILVHPDMEDAQRIFAALAKLQAYGIHYAINNREKIEDNELMKEYAKTIEELLDDPNERLNLEATSANANFRVGLYIDKPDESTSHNAVKAISKLLAISPKNPVIQTTRRVLLERIWNSDKPDIMLKELADSGDIPSKIALEQVTENSDRKKAEFLWMKHFAKFNDFAAMVRLAKMYETGEGTTVNNTQAARWYEKLVRIGDINSQVKLGDFYLQGKGYSKNPETALEYYQAAARARSRVAQFKLGECYRLGLGAEQSDENWRKWIKSAAFNATSVDVQEIYNSTEFESAPDSFQVFYESLVDQNPDDIFYLNNLAFSLLIGTKKDPERSLELIDEAIEIAPKDFEGLANFKDTRAHALKHLGKHKDAAELFESILDEIEDKKPVLEALVECYEELDEDKAEQYRNQLAELSDK